MLRLSSPGRGTGRMLAVNSGGARTLTPTQALVASFAGTGLLDALLLFDPAHFAAPGSSPGTLVDALGGPISYTAPNTQATPALVQHPSGYSYISADGVDDALNANANQVLAWWCAVFRSAPTKVAWDGYGTVISNSTVGDRTGLFAAGGTDFYPTPAIRAVQRNGLALSGSYNMAPITEWMVLSVFAPVTPAQLLQLCSVESGSPTSMDVAAVGLRYTDPTSDQQGQIQAKFAPVRDALLASA